MSPWIMPDSQRSRLAISTQDLARTQPTNEHSGGPAPPPRPSLGLSEPRSRPTIKRKEIRALQEAIYRPDDAAALPGDGDMTPENSRQMAKPHDSALGQVMASAYAATGGHLGEEIGAERRNIRAAVPARTALLVAGALIALALTVIIWHHHTMATGPSTIAMSEGGLSGQGERPTPTRSPSATDSSRPTTSASGAHSERQSASEPTSEPAPTMVVYVSGEVKTPGVVHLSTSARVVDAVQAAGGFTAEADQAAVNLAATIADGQQVHIPPLSATVSLAPGIRGGPPGSTPPASTNPGTGPGTAPVNLNTASVEQLQSLPRIGPSLAARIIEYRSQNGPFSSVEDIANISGIGPAIIEAIRDKVVLTP